MRGNDQQAYDRGTSLFSPDGRIYQVEYAREAVSRGAPSVGVRTQDGVVLAAETQSSSPLLIDESIEKLHKLDDHLGTTNAGHVADARQLIDYARRMAQGDRLRYGEPVGVETVTKYVTDHVQENTQRGGTRPYGVALLIGGVEDGEPRLFGADPTGTPREWKATAIGGSRGELQEILEDGWSEELSLDDGVSLAVEALATVVDEVDDEAFSVATIDVEEGYGTMTDDEVATRVEELDIDEE
ncbi:MAG: proteasome endopeptidase complex, archaeal, alpha subunit [halophilic archaeon J07HB67]|jgi:proteasome endopeptidase complex, archaeal, alpha subunit|nr:MAG: proteasome endopeptidase complex, archaeal, alpha subunit [halophilic archaeon J07HB67]